MKKRQLIATLAILSLVSCGEGGITPPPNLQM